MPFVAAPLSMEILLLVWRLCWVLLGTPRLTLPVMPAGAMPTWRRPWHMWPRYLIASIVEVQLAVLLAVGLEAAELDDRLPWALKESTLQLAEVAPQAAVLPLMAAVQVARPV